MLSLNGPQRTPGKLNSGDVRVRVAAVSSRSVQLQATSVRCMMEGCRAMPAAGSEVCEKCRQKQLQAYEGNAR